MTEYIYDTSIEATFLHEQKHEEIVRCRDCVYMHTVRSWLGMDVDECWLHAEPETGALGKEPTEPDGFCAWGERANFATCKCGEDIELGERESAVCPRCNRTVRA